MRLAWETQHDPISKHNKTLSHIAYTPLIYLYVKTHHINKIHKIAAVISRNRMVHCTDKLQNNTQIIPQPAHGQHSEFNRGNNP